MLTRRQPISGVCPLLFFLFLGVCVFTPQSAVAEPKPRTTKVSTAQVNFEQARSSFAKVQQTDPNVTDLAAWERSAARLTKFVTDYSTSEFVPEAYFTLGQLYEQTYAKRQSHMGLVKAVYFYERLAKEYQGNARVPEALLHLGDLRRNDMKDEAAARSAYYELVDVYPKSPLAQTAKLRLGLEEKPAAEKAPNVQAAAAPSPSPSPAAPSGGESPGFISRLFPSEPSVPTDGKEIFSTESKIKRPLIVIDPGHGGDEHGASGVDGVPEKDVVLNISLYLDELLRERLRARTVLTRTKDMTLSLADRTKIANEHGADLFVSIHANASEYKNVKGIETYYLDNTNEKSSLKLAERENASLQNSGTDLGFIISDFIQSAKLDESIALAHHVQSGVVESISRYFEGVKDLGVKKAPFYVLVGAHMPCVLAEVSFIDHPGEGARLITPRYQRLVALGLYQGIKSYFEQRGK